MAQWARVLSALLRNLSVIPCTVSSGSELRVTPDPGIQQSWPLRASTHRACPHTDTHIHTTKQVSLNSTHLLPLKQSKSRHKVSVKRKK